MASYSSDECSSYCVFFLLLLVVLRFVILVSEFSEARASNRMRHVFLVRTIRERFALVSKSKG